jgi:hypothetical protein
MKNTLLEFIPFEHKNVDYINRSLELARQQRQSGSIEAFMASAVIYANLAEYLARNLLENLQQMFYLLSYKSFNGIYFIKNKSAKKNPKMLGQIADSLSIYEFPDCSAFIELIRKFSEARAILFHKLLTEEGDTKEFDEKIGELHSMAEEILDKYNSITQGIGNQWYAYVNNYFAQNVEQQNRTEYKSKQKGDK